MATVHANTSIGLRVSFFCSWLLSSLGLRSIVSRVIVFHVVTPHPERIASCIDGLALRRYHRRLADGWRAGRRRMNELNHESRVSRVSRQSCGNVPLTKSHTWAGSKLVV
jgi:hypothetical protein